MRDLLPFTGRDAELALLGRALEGAVEGHGQLWLVSGEPGIGKTRLVEELAASAAEHARVLFGSAWEAGGAPAFWPWITALRQLLRELDDAALARLLGTRAPWLGQLLPELEGRLGELAHPPALDPEQARFQLLDSIACVLRDVARTRPLLLVLEDLHAADPSSLLLLDFIARELRTAPLLVIGTYREAEARQSAGGPLLARLVRHARCLALGRLDEPTVSAFLRRVLGGAVTAATIATVFHTSEGNPLFVSEAARLLRQGGDARAVPAGVRGAIRARLEGLPDAARETLARASVLGREFSLDELAGLAELPATDLAERLQPAIDVALLSAESNGRYRFSHFCVREVIHDDLPPPRRWALHRRVADELEARACLALEPAYSELAHHLLEAGPDARELAFDAMARAAEHALAQLAFDDAAVAYARALELAWPGLPARRRVELLFGLGRALTFSGEASRGRACFERALGLARQQGDPELLGHAALALGSDLVFAEVDPALVRALEDALAGLPEGPTPLRAELMARLSAAMQPAADPSVAIDMARCAIGMARDLGDPRTLLGVLRNGCSALMDMVDAAERLPLNREMARLAAELDSPLDALRAAQRLVFDHVELGERAGVVQALRRFHSLAASLAHPVYRARSAALEAMLAIHDGRFAEAETQLEESRRLASKSSDRNGARGALLQRLGLARLRGDRAGMRRHLSDFEALELSDYIRGMAATLAVEAWADADRDAARARLSSIDVPLLLRAGDVSLIEPLVYGLDALGDVRHLDAIHEVLLPRTDRFVSWGAFGLLWGPPVSFLLGIVERLRGNVEAALEQLERGQALAEAVQSAPHALLCLLERARVCVAAGRLVEAERARAQAAERAEALGVPALLARYPVAGRLQPARADARSAASAPALPSSSRASLPASRPSASRLGIERDGETWSVSHAGKTFRLRDSKGMRLLARLLADPGREFHALDLVGSAELPGETGMPLLDDRARAAYRERVDALREALDEAERCGDAGRRERASAELEQVRSELARAVGLGGRTRRAGDAAERARVNVQRRLRDAIGRIREQDPALAKHLDWAVRTGTFCTYDPS
jgi:tetratricopeptide (TPR) repeat protein